MAGAQKRTFMIGAEQASYIDRLVRSGSYADENEVVQASLDALHARDEDIEAWLREEVLPAYEEGVKHPETVLDLDVAFEKLRQRHAGGCIKGPRP